MADNTRNWPELTKEEQAEMSDASLYVKAISDLVDARKENDRLRAELDKYNCKRCGKQIIPTCDWYCCGEVHPFKVGADF